MSKNPPTYSYEPSADFALELLISGDQRAGEQELEFYRLAEDITLEAAINLAIRIGGPIRRIGRHQDALLGAGQPGYWLETKRHEFNVIDLAVLDAATEVMDT